MSQAGWLCSHRRCQVRTHVRAHKVHGGGRRRALYEPVHGSAPDIAGESKANPLATLLSFAMCLRYSFDMSDDAEMVEKACANVLDAGYRTGDIMQDGMTLVSTQQMGEKVCEELNKLAA